MSLRGAGTTHHFSCLAELPTAVSCGNNGNAGVLLNLIPNGILLQAIAPKSAGSFSPSLSGRVESMELAQQQEWDEGSGICGGNVGKKTPQTQAREGNNLNFESLALTGRWRA